MKNIPVRKIAPAQGSTGKTGRFTIREVAQLVQGRDLVHDLHRHDFFFILALEKGSGLHEIDFTPYEIHDHSLFIIRPGQVHRLELASGSKGYLLEFDQAFYRPTGIAATERWEKATRQNYSEPEKSRFLKLLSILANVFKEYTSREEGYEEAIQASLDLFFIEYIRQSPDPASIPKTGSAYSQERFEELLRLLEKNIGTMKNVSQYASLLSLSSYQLNAITKSAVGKTVSDLINEQIILEAKRHLLATSWQVKDIADYLGYEDVSYFIRFFKKQTGQSPEAFRKNFK
jgi:AraC-like DNA-binding protein